MGYVLAWAGMHEDRHVTFLPAYGAEVRGGTANCTVVVSDQEIASPVASHPEFAVAMNYPSVQKYENLVKTDGIMFVNCDLVSDLPSRKDIRVMEIPANSLAHEIGNDRTLNMIMLGAMAEATRVVSADALAQAVETVLGDKKLSLIEINKKALVRGAEFMASGN